MHNIDCKSSIFLVPLRYINYPLHTMRTLVFATNNPHKAHEIEQILDGQFSVKTLKDIGCDIDIPETADTLEGNALIKARYVKEHYG